MKKIYGMNLDIEKSSNGTDDIMWSLYFTEGEFQSNQISKSTEPIIFRLKRKDYYTETISSYFIFFNPYNNKYTILNKKELECIEKDYGYYIGGFIVLSDCRLIFLHPDCKDDIEYKRIRNFSEEFTEAYENRSIDCEGDPEICGAFREINFNNDFDIGCPIIEEDNEFNEYEFDDSYNT